MAQLPAVNQRTRSPGLRRRPATDRCEDEKATIRIADPFAALAPTPASSDVSGSSTSEIVDAGGLKPNTWQRFERLSSA